MTQLLNFAIGGGLIATPFAFIYLYAKYKHYKELSVFNENQAEKYIKMHEEERQKRLKDLNKFLSFGNCLPHTKPYIITYSKYPSGKFKGRLELRAMYASGDTLEDMLENMRGIFERYCGSVIKNENKIFDALDVTNMTNVQIKSYITKARKSN